MNFYRRQLLRQSAWVLLFLLGVGGIAALQRSRLQLSKAQLSAVEYEQQSQKEKLQLDVLEKLPSLGFGNLMADWAYLGFIQYFGDSTARDVNGYSLIPDYFRLTVQRDPRFADAMLAMASANTLFAGEPQKTVQYLTQGLQHVSQEQTVFANQLYFLWIYKGRDEFLFLGDVKAAIASNDMAIRWAKALNTPRSLKSVENLTATNSFLSKNPKSKTARIGSWSMVLSTSFDLKTQRRIISEIQALGGIVTQSPDGRLSVRVPDGVE